MIYECMVKNPGGDAYNSALSHIENAINRNFCSSPQTIAYAFWYFLNGQTFDYYGYNFGDEDGDGVSASEAMIDSTPSIDKWNAYKVDTSNLNIGDYLKVTFEIKHTKLDFTNNFTYYFMVVEDESKLIDSIDINIESPVIKTFNR